MPRRQKIRFLGMNSPYEAKFTSDPDERSPFNPNIMLDLLRNTVKTKEGSWGLGMPFRIRRRKR
jgi:hypothetical protein